MHHAIYTPALQIVVTVRRIRINIKRKHPSNSFDSTAEILNDDSFDPDVNFFNNNIENLDTPYISHEKIKDLNVNTAANTLSVLHLNIRSMKKNFESFKLFLSNFNFDFSIICFSETWLDDSSSLPQSLYELPKYKCIH